MSETPKACPACGGKAILDPDEAMTPRWVECEDIICDLEGPKRLTAAEAIAAWNALPRWEWVPAGELPVQGEWVLVWDSTFARCDIGGYHDHVGGWVTRDDGGDEDAVTHWQPLPPGPKTEGSDR